MSPAWNPVLTKEYRSNVPRTRLAMCATTATALLLSACGSSTSPPSAKELIDTSQKAVAKAKSVHLVDVTKVAGSSQTIVGDLSLTAGQETFSIDKKVAIEILLSNETVYVRTSSDKVLTSSLSLSAAAAKVANGNWISMTSADKPYASVVQSLSIDANVSSYYPPVKGAEVMGSTTDGGVSVFPIMGTTTTSSKAKVAMTLNVAESTSLPTSGHLKATQGKNSETKVGTFSKWNKPVSITIPDRSITLASLLAVP